jgi:hypothetical protein
MKAAGLTETAMARRMATGRAKPDRLLDPANTSVTLHAVHKAAAVVGRRLRLQLVCEAGKLRVASVTVQSTTCY